MTNSVSKPFRDEHSRLGAEAAVSVARENGLRVEEPVVLSDLFSLMVHLKPAPVIARVATRLTKLGIPLKERMEREVSAASFLYERGVPVVPPSSELPPGPHERDGFPISFWRYIEADRERTPTTDDCSGMLIGLHRELKAYPGELGVVGSQDIPYMMKFLDRDDDVLSEEEADLIREAEERLRPFWEDPRPDFRPIHGDVHPGNMIAARDGSLLWIDFEGVCLGPVEWDLSAMFDPEAVAKYHDPDPDLMATCAELRALEVALSLVSFYDEFGDSEGWDEGLRYMISALGRNRWRQDEDVSR